MSEKQAFYERVHDERPDYSGSVYDLGQLLDTKAFGQWARLQTGRKAAILDLGCGKGFFLRDFISEGAKRRIEVGRAVGLDLVRSSGNVFDEAPGQYEFVQGSVDGEAWPFADATFDVIACNHILEHVFETEMLVREIRRCLTPTGLAVISVPNIAAWINRVLFLFGGQPLGTEVGTESSVYGFWPAFGQKHLAQFKPAGHIRDFTPRALADLCESCGLEVVGWWNQSKTPFFPLTRWAGRNMGVIVRRGAD
jgi:SAM-dependent methyltransferase